MIPPQLGKVIFHRPSGSVLLMNFWQILHSPINRQLTQVKKQLKKIM
jgi:hypothetical protein